MVTWGQDQVRLIPPAAAAAPPAGGGLFGTPTPSPSPGGSIFGSPAPAPSAFGAFGSPAPATTAFGSPAAPSTSLFGTPSSTSLFGQAPATAASTFGSTLQQQGQQHIPAQAALQAHMDASARQEAEKIRLGLETLHCAYTGNVRQGSSSNESSKFVTITYNDMTADQRQLQFLHGLGANGNGRLMAPPKPPQVSDGDWREAVVKNPDSDSYMPTALAGAMALQARVSWQQDRAKELAANITSLSQTHELLKDRCSRVNQNLEHMQRQHAAVRKRLLDVMRRVELARCMNQQIMPDELRLIERLKVLERELESTRSVFWSLQDKARARSATGGAAQSRVVTAIPDRDQLFSVFKLHREELTRLTATVHRDLRDIELIKKRTEEKLPVAPRV